MRGLSAGLVLALGSLGCNAILGTGDYSVGEGGAAASAGTGTTTSVVGSTGSTTSSSQSSTSVASGTGGAGGDGVTVGPGGGGGGGGDGGSSAGGGGSGGGGPDPCDVPLADKPIVEIEGEIASSVTLTCDKSYKLVGEVFVLAPAELTVQAGTTLFGDKVTGAALVIRPGAKIIANGTPSRPIVFTSEGGAFSDPGDWGGLVLLGNAPINVRDGNGNPTTGTVEGIVDVANATYGGNAPDDSSGSLQYVRVEYGGKAIAPNNELNGVTFGGVGRGTVVDHVQVRQTTDDCFEFFGGTVDAKHLICQAPGDDGFDWDFGFSGRLQFLVLQQDVAYPAPQDMNGFEGDNDAAGSGNLPQSSPTIYNATLCGRDYNAGQQYGMLLRKNTLASIHNVFVSGFEAAVDVRNASGPLLDVGNSVFFGNTLLAYPENQAAPYNDDDAAFDEVAWLQDVANANDFADPGITGCGTMSALLLSPAAPIDANAVAPPDDGFFDADAAYIGAFADTADDWATGAWVVWKAD